MPITTTLGTSGLTLAPPSAAIGDTAPEAQSAMIDRIAADFDDLSPVPLRDPLEAALQCLARGDCTTDESGSDDLGDTFVFAPAPGLGADEPPLGGVAPLAEPEPAIPEGPIGLTGTVTPSDLDATFPAFDGVPRIGIGTPGLTLPEGPIGLTGPGIPEGPIGITGVAALVGTGGALPLLGLGGPRYIVTDPADGPSLTPTLPTITVPHGPQELVGLGGVLPLAGRTPDADAFAGLTPVAIDDGEPVEVALALQVADRPEFDLIRRLHAEPLSLHLFEDNVADGVLGGYKFGLTELGLG